MHKEWFEPVLASHLGRVAAPDELWERIQRPRQRNTHVPTGANAAWICACAALILVAMWLYPWNRGLRTNDAGQMRAWVRDHAGIDLPLQTRPGGVQLIGVKASKDSVEIAYRVRNRDGRLIVGSQHRPSAGVKVFIGSVDGHTFTLECATPEDLRMACGLCHIG